MAIPIDTRIGILILSGCNGIEEIVGKVNIMLDQQLEETESEKMTTEDTVDEGNESVADKVANDSDANKANIDEIDDIADEMSDGHENEADPMLSFNERLQKAGYTKIDPPNGLRIPLLLDWVFVQEINNDP